MISGIADIGLVITYLGAAWAVTFIIGKVRPEST